MSYHPNDHSDKQVIGWCIKRFSILRFFGARMLIRAFIYRAHERGFINSASLHDLHAMNERVFGKGAK